MFKIACSVNVIMVLMEHPPKQGLKPDWYAFLNEIEPCFNGTSTKTRIETCDTPCPARVISGF